MSQNKLFRKFSITTIWFWLAIFALIPSFFLLITSILIQGDNELVRLQLTISNYLRLFNSYYLQVFGRSFMLAGICTIGCLILGYPFSYLIARTTERYKNILLLLVIIPFWTSSLIRSYAIIAILKTHGILNKLLLWSGIIQTPIQIMYTNTATLIGLIYTLLPLMILPLYASIEKLDVRIIDAAKDLGAKRHQVFLKIIVPLTSPGIFAGCVLVFLPAMTMFYIPDLLGGAKTILIGNIIQNQFLAARDWPMGAAISVALTLFMGMVLLIYWKRHPHQQELL
jgi:spermidine/putrescine transport system permease protein